MAQEVTTLKGIEQGRAKYAFEAVKEISENNLRENDSKKLKESYKSVAKKLPVLIKTNGLGQTLAFMKSKRAKRDKPENGYDKLYQQLGKWLQTESENQLIESGELVEKIILLNSSVYRQATIETLALLNWMRRFVDGLMKDVDDTETNDD